MLGLTGTLELVRNTGTLKRNAENVLDDIEMGDIYMNTNESERRFIFC
jgi:hypothetical protein